MRGRIGVAVGLVGVLVLVNALDVQPTAASSPFAESVPAQAAVDPVAIALAYLADDAASMGPSAAAVDVLVATDVVPTEHNGLTHVYVQQQHNGIDIFNAVASVAVEKDGSVLTAASRLVETAEVAADLVIDAVAAAGEAAAALGLEPSSSFEGLVAPSGADQSQELSDGGISLSNIQARLVYQPVGAKTIRLAWELTIESTNGVNWWQIRIDAETGAELDRNDLVVSEDFGGTSEHADAHTVTGVAGAGAPTEAAVPSAAGLVADGSSYSVFAQPLEAPSFGGRTTVAQPADASASPFGWHDTNGAAGAESTLTLGNNVHAYTDIDSNNLPDFLSEPDGGAGLDFVFPLDLTQPPSAYRPAAVTNLFYWNNITHDFLYAYGFDEAAGNFQFNNYGEGGAGGDAVRAEAQDGGGLNNANFFTPVDGSAPRMQMYVWDSPNPDRDGDLDNGIILHEYAHGLSIRLTGGPSNVTCLNNAEQAGEGWSDYITLMGTMKAGDTATQRRGIGTYALNQPTNGNGIRAFPYSTDMTIDPRTYDSIKTATVPHGVGSTFTAMLWEMTWALIDEHGFDPDLARGTGGNNIAMQLVVDGLKMQPCSPGFVDARNAILAADVANSAGANSCLIWNAFAKRGLGFSANQGSSSSATDGTQAFDVAPACLPLGLDKTASVASAEAGGRITYSLLATNQSPVDQTNVTVTDTVPTGSSYVAGSATCGGSHVAGVVTFNVGTLAPAANRTCTFTVVTPSDSYSAVTFSDDFDPDASAWTVSHGAGTLDWAPTAVTPRSAPNAMFATEPATVSDQYLRLTDPILLPDQPSLSFWHQYDFESTFDGGVVEISTDSGMTWADLGTRMTQNGYDATINGTFASPIALRRAFTGARTTYRETIVDLADFVGQQATFRFRAASDNSVSRNGWRVDDVTIGKFVDITNTASAQSDQTTAISSNAVVTEIVAPTPPGVPGSVSAAWSTTTSAKVSFTAPSTVGRSVVTGYSTECTSSDGGTTRTSSGAVSPLTVSSLTAGKTYKCRVRAANVVGNGAYSALVPAVLKVPSVPRSVSAVWSTTTSAKVSFTAPLTNGGRAVTSYTAQCTSSNGGTTRAKSGAVGPLTVSSLTAGKTYKCRVRAVNSVGAGAYSALVSAVFTVPGVPRSVSATRLTSTSARVSFAAPLTNGGKAITAYTAQCTSTNGGTARAKVGAASPLTVSSLTAGKTYKCRVRATNSVGPGPYSAFDPV